MTFWTTENRLIFLGYPAIKFDSFQESPISVNLFHFCTQAAEHWWRTKADAGGAGAGSHYTLTISNRKWALRSSWEQNHWETVGKLSHSLKWVFLFPCQRPSPPLLILTLRLTTLPHTSRRNRSNQIGTPSFVHQLASEASCLGFHILCLSSCC